MWESILQFCKYFRCHGKENHDKPIYGCKFNHLLKESLYIFATVGGNNISIFQCLSNGLVDMLLTFDDPDVSQSFIFHSSFMLLGLTRTLTLPKAIGTCDQFIYVYICLIGE